MWLKLFSWSLLFFLVFSAQAQLKAFKENWSETNSANFILVSNGGSKATSNFPDPDAEDGKALQLMVGKGVGASPKGGSEVESKSSFLYGTLTARLKTVHCTEQPNAGVVTGYFTYFNDGSDKNGDGLPDNSELDFEWLCADPAVIYLTLWTDYRDSDNKGRRISRVLNLATGVIASTAFKTDWGEGTKLTGIENEPSTLKALPGYNSSTEYYEYGISWSVDRMLLWIINPKDKSRITLWDYRGPAARIPARASQYMINAWHTSTWNAPSNPASVQSPTNSVSAYVDWAAFDPTPVPTALKSNTIAPILTKRGGAPLLPRFDAQGIRQNVNFQPSSTPVWCLPRP